MQCQKCGTDAPLYQVTFRQNIGLVIMHIYKTYSGAFCKKCAKSTFWSTFFTNLFLGWWGIKSFFYTFYYMITNITQAVKLGKMEPVAGSASTAHSIIQE